MDTKNTFQQPAVLEEGKGYLLRLAQRDNGVPILIEVTFVEYTSCPAVVIVQDARQERMRCSRGDLFS
jgi:hypothetical protein